MHSGVALLKCISFPHWLGLLFTIGEDEAAAGRLVKASGKVAGEDSWKLVFVLVESYVSCHIMNTLIACAYIP